MTVLITLVIPPGGDVNNFSLYSDATGYSIPFATNISAAVLTAGYTTSAVPNGTTIIRATSTGLCTDFIDITVTLLPPPTTTTTSTTSSGLTFCNVITSCIDGFTRYAEYTGPLSGVNVNYLPISGVIPDDCGTVGLILEQAIPNVTIEGYISGCGDPSCAT